MSSASNTLLDDRVLSQIDEALHAVGEYGEVRLVVVKGRVRFIQTVQSEQVKETRRTY